MEEKKVERDRKEFEFERVEISDFFDKETMDEKEIQSGIIVFTEYQQQLIEKLRNSLKETSPEKLARMENRLLDMTNLAQAIARFPSLLERSNTMTSTRTPEALAESMVSHYEDGDTVMHMPSKASLGRGFLITKIHTFYSMWKLARDFAHMEEKEAHEYLDETVSMLFTLMAEDVYLDLIRDKSISIEVRREAANSLIILWEHRSDQTIADIAPVLQAVWHARRQLAPTFGTMMGTSELLMVTFQMDEQWSAFIREKLAVKEISQAMEEFLFGISYEQILRLKEILRENGLKSISRDEARGYLNERIKLDINQDYRDFYLLYTIRRDNARTRNRLHLDGPKSTLEDFFVRFVMEKNQEKQKKDSFAG